MEASHKRSSISAMKLALEALELYQSKSSVQMFDDAVRALRQALEEKQDPVAWQPIESAPKTGRKVILFYKNRLNVGRTVIARWLTDEQATEIDADDVGLEGGWYECIDNWDDFTEVAIHGNEPSHWMPLPAPPIEALRQALETEQKPVAWRSISPDGKLSNKFACKPTEGNWVEPLYTAPPKREWVGLTDEEIDALSQARSLTDELMDCVDRLGSETDTVDPRVWQHLLVYAPKPEEEPVAWITNGGKGELWWHRSSKFDEEGNLIGPNPDDIPLYTAPPKKQWVGLTLNEAEDFYEKYTDRAELINAIDRFLEEKNA